MRALIHTILLGAGLLPGATIYSVVDLGSFGGGSSVAYRINNAGKVAGWSETPQNDNHAFASSAGSLQDLNPLTASNSQAFAINSSGQIAGESFINGQNHGAVWSGSTVTDLGAGSSAMAINTSGVVAGGNGHAFVYQQGAFTDLGTLAGGRSATAYAINDSGMVAGYGDVGNGNFRGFTWTAATGLTMLGTLGGNSSYALAINNQGQVAGNSTAANGYMHAFLGDHGILTDLGTLGGGNSFAYGINNSGAVVGYSGADAFLYRNGTLSDLNSLVASSSGWQLEQAYGINDGGQIVGTGLYRGQSHAFVLNPVNRFAAVSNASVPEPGTVTLFALGLGSLLSAQACRRVKTRKDALLSPARHNL